MNQVVVREVISCQDVTTTCRTLLNNKLLAHLSIVRSCIESRKISEIDSDQRSISGTISPGSSTLGGTASQCVHSFHSVYDQKRREITIRDVAFHTYAMSTTTIDVFNALGMCHKFTMKPPSAPSLDSECVCQHCQERLDHSCDAPVTKNLLLLGRSTAGMLRSFFSKHLTRTTCILSEWDQRSNTTNVAGAISQWFCCFLP